MPRGELVLEGDRVGFRTSMTPRFPGEFPFPWSRLADDEDAPLGLDGVGETPLRYTIATFRGQMVHPQAITPISEVFLVR